MRWKNKGHEFDVFGNRLAKEYIRRKHIYIFGAGFWGEKINSFLKNYDCVECFIDNDCHKQHSVYEGKWVISFDEYLKQSGNGWIIIAADKKNVSTISKQLEKENLIRDYDFFEYERFVKEIFPVMSVYCFNKAYIELAQICLTERCTLKCKKCAHGCNAVNKNASDLTLEKVFQSADVFFKKVDWIKEFVLIGGEPFLYRDLDKVLEYIGKKYRDQMMFYSITTNGTIIPSKEVLDMCKIYNCKIDISNYMAQIPHLKQKYEDLTTVLEKNRIEYSLWVPGLEWMDYGFGQVDRGGEKEVLTQAFDACKTPCREIRGNKFYYCVMARSVSDNLGYGIGNEDFLDMEKLCGDDYKKILLEFTYGYSDKGYLDMCNYCRGTEAVSYPIPAAEQEKKN